MKIKFCVSLLAIVLGLSTIFTGCSSNKVTATNFTKIQTGDSEQKVIEILGEPTSVDSSGMLGVTGTSYLYRKGEKQVTIVFLNGKVIAKEGSL